MAVKNFKKKLLMAVIIWILAFLSISSFFYSSVEFDPELFAKRGLNHGGAIFFDRYGRELRFLPGIRGERARWTSLQNIPDIVRDAFIAAEDERFYNHHGFDPIAIIRAAWGNITKGKIVSGASTISQQLVRLLDSEKQVGNGKRKRAYRDKLVEVVRSVKMERIFSKNKILEHYLNRAPMGNNLTGVETAAWAYFGTSVKNLSVSEAALLAALPKAPGMLNPYGSRFDRLLERRNWILGRMNALGMLPDNEYLIAKNQKPRLRTLTFVSGAPHVVDMLMQKGVGTTGSVRTTIDLDLQQRVQEILASHGERLKYRGASQVAAIVIDNATTEVLASVGSIEYSEKNNGFNNGVLALRSAGSTLKPFLYALAVESGETAAMLLSDTERKYRSPEGQYSPLNFDRKEYGPVTMRSALGNSLNLSAVKMLERTGEDRFYRMLKRINLISHPERGPEHYGLGMAIGNPEVSPEQLGAAYAMLANGGVYKSVRYTLETSRTGSSDKPIYVFLPQTAYIITDILSDPTARTLTFNRSRLMTDFPFKVAIKTGTSTFYRDLWAAGYTPDYTVVVWVGNFDGSPTKNLTGSSGAVPIFADIMTWLYRQSDPVPFRQPKGIRRMMICGHSGMKPAQYCTHRINEVFITGTEPRETCSFHEADSKRHELASPYAGWLYEKNRKGSAGRFRLAGFGDDLNSLFHEPMQGAPAEPGVKAKNIETAPAASRSENKPMQRENAHYRIGGTPPGHEPAAGGMDASEIKIIYPLDHDRFVINRHDKNQTIKFQSTVGRPVAYVDWFINGRHFKRTGPPYQVYWNLEEGKYRVTAVLPSQIGDSVQMEVE